MFQHLKNVMNSTNRYFCDIAVMSEIDFGPMIFNESQLI